MLEKKGNEKIDKQLLKMMMKMINHIYMMKMMKREKGSTFFLCFKLKDKGKKRKN